MRGAGPSLMLAVCCLFGHPAAALEPATGYRRGHLTNFCAPWDSAAMSLSFKRNDDSGERLTVLVWAAALSLGETNLSATREGGQTLGSARECDLDGCKDLPGTMLSVTAVTDGVYSGEVRVPVAGRTLVFPFSAALSPTKQFCSGLLGEAEKTVGFLAAGVVSS